MSFDEPYEPEPTDDPLGYSDFLRRQIIYVARRHRGKIPELDEQIDTFDQWNKEFKIDTVD